MTIKFASLNIWQPLKFTSLLFDLLLSEKEKQLSSGAAKQHFGQIHIIYAVY